MNAEPDDFILAMRAVKAAIDRDAKNTVICFEDGSIFRVCRGKSGWSVQAETKSPLRTEP